MQMWIPIFLLFSVYGVINTYLPIFLRNMGYSISIVGILLAIFEVAGAVFPFLLSPLVDKRGNYGSVAVIYGIMLILLPLPLINISGFWFSALFLSLYAVGFKGLVPVTDSHVSHLLGKDIAKYGRVRVAGSIGFVAMALLLQFVAHMETAPHFVTVLWMSVPAALFTASLCVIPGLLLPCTVSESPQKSEVESVESVKIRESFLKKTVSSIKEFPRIFWLGMAFIFLAFFGMVPASRFLSLYIVDELGLHNFAILWAISAGAEIPFMFFANRFLKSFNSLKVIIFCTFFVSVRSLLYIIFPTFGGAVAAQLCNAVTYGIFHPAAVLFVSTHSPKNNLVLGMTLYSLVNASFAVVLGNIAGGFIIEAFGYKALFIIFACVPLCGLGTYFYTVFKRKRK